MALDGATASFLPYTLNGLQDIAVDSSTVSTLQVNSLTPNRAVVSDGSNFLVSAGATSTEVDYLSGTTSNIQTQINSKASTSYVDTNFLNKTTATQQDITAFCNFNSIGATTVGMSNGLQWYKNNPFQHQWTITRRIGTGSVLKDLAFRDEENGVDTLLLSEEGQTVFVGLKCDYTTASKIPIFDASKKLVSSGVDSIKITYLDNVSSDIQTQLNGKLNLSGNNANQDIVIGTYKVQSSSAPTTGNDYTNKTYVDGQISGLGSVYLPLAGGVMTGDITGASFNYLRWGRSGDVRNNLAPNYVPGASMAWYFGTYANDNTGSFADHIIPNGWVDSSGGLTNMLSLNKGGKGIRQFQQTYGSSSGFATWYDCVMTDANSADVSIGGVLTAPTVNVSGQTVSRVCVFDASKNVVSSSVSSTTLTYLDIGSSLTGLLNNKADLSYVNTQLALKANLTGGNTFSGDQVVNSGSLSISSRLLGTPDGSPSGNFWIGLRGTGTEVDRLAIGINGNQTTGVVGFVSIPKTLNLGSLTANRVLIIDGSNNVGSSSVSTTTLSYLDATSSVQNQLNAKANLAGGNVFTGFQTFSDETASRVPVFDAGKRLRASSTTQLELSYLSGTTSSVQTQINSRVAKAGDVMSGQLSMSGSTQIEFGNGVVKEANAGKIGYGWVTANCLDIVGGGTTAAQRAVVCYDRLGVGVAPTTAFQVSGTGSFSGSLGIGTTSPAQLLDITSSGLTPAIRIQNTYSAGYLSMGSVVGVNSYIGLQATNTTTSALSTPTLVVANNGNVGIGTADPTTKLHTYEFATNVIRLQTSGVDNSYLIGNHEYLSLNANSDASGVRTNTGRGSSAIILQQPTAGGFIRFFTSPAINTNIEERMRITANGYVGIGTTTPASKLHLYEVFSTDITLQTSSVDYSYIRGTDDNLTFYKNLTPAGVIQNTGRGSAQIQMRGTTSGGLISFSTSPNINTAIQERMTILPNGNVGIGTNNPATKLHVTGTSRLDGNCQIGNEAIIANYIAPFQNANVVVSRAGTSASLAVVAGNEASDAILYLGTPHTPTTSTQSAYKCAIIAEGRTNWSTSNLHFCLNGATGSNDVSQNANLTHSKFQIASDGVCFHTAGDNSYIRYGPNSTWSSYLHVGATSNKVGQPETAQVITTNGNIHIDAGYDRDIYLGLYASIAGRTGNFYLYADVSNVYYFGALSSYTTAGGWVNVSDEREKVDIQPLKTDKSLKRVLALKPKHYRRKYREDSVSDEIKQARHVGFIAQEVQKSNPHCVSKWSNKDSVKKRDEAKVEINVDDDDVKVEISIEEEEDDGERFGMSYNDYVVHLVGAVQEQQKQIELLTQRNQILEEHARKLEADMAEYKEQTDRRMTQLAELVKGLLEEPKLKRIKTLVRE